MILNNKIVFGTPTNFSVAADNAHWTLSEQHEKKKWKLFIKWKQMTTTFSEKLLSGSRERERKQKERNDCERCDLKCVDSDKKIFILSTNGKPVWLRPVDELLFLFTFRFSVFSFPHRLCVGHSESVCVCLCVCVVSLKCFMLIKINLSVNKNFQEKRR